jgi:hypothetical protein
LSIKEGACGIVRYIGMDVHREFAQLAVVEDGLLRDEGRIAVTPEALRRWAVYLRLDDEVALVPLSGPRMRQIRRHLISLLIKTDKSPTDAPLRSVTTDSGAEISSMATSSWIPTAGRVPGRQRKITGRPETSGSATDKRPDIVIVGDLLPIQDRVAVRAASWPAR